MRHKYTIVVARHSNHVTAHCACSWRSPPQISAGLAGACWDQHFTDAASDAPKVNAESTAHR